MDWVPMPNKMDGDGYTQLVDHPNAAAHFGAWCAIVEICSRQRVRGTLPQAGAGKSQEGAGIPQALAGISQALARISRLPQQVYEEVLPRLLEIGWIEQVREIPHPPAEIPHPPAEIPHPPAEIPHPPAVHSRDTRAVTERKGREGKGTEGKAPAAPGGGGSPADVRKMAQQFERWWKLWASVRGTHHRQQAEGCYLRVVPEDAEEECLLCTASYLQSLSDPTRGYNPENFLAQQSAEHFTVRWPSRRVEANGSSPPTLADRTVALMKDRIAKGEKPF